MLALVLALTMLLYYQLLLLLVHSFCWPPGSQPTVGDRGARSERLARSGTDVAASILEQFDSSLCYLGALVQLWEIGFKTSRFFFFF